MIHKGNKPNTTISTAPGCPYHTSYRNHLAGIHALRTLYEMM